MNKNIPTADFLLEIGTEELPAKQLRELITNLSLIIESKLKSAELDYEEAVTYATPRRLAILIRKLVEKQHDRIVEKRGPALSAAFDEDGRPTTACLGFANSCQIAVAELETYKTSSGSWVLYRKPQEGKKTIELMPKIINESLAELPHKKTMHWGAGNALFVRPVRWVVMLYGKELIKANIFGLETQRESYGHRFLHSDAIKINEASLYPSLLHNTGKVIADFDERKEIIMQQIADLTKTIGAAVIDDELLDETAALTEWPVALLGSFDKNFLEIPMEALKAVMKNSQRCFYLVNKEGGLLPHFIAVSNIESNDPERVIKGNERVMRARLSDLKFFYETDLKEPLEFFVDKLKDVVYQAKLGTLRDKINRLEPLAALIAEKIGTDITATKRAAYLSKMDLATGMVKEQPDLQGVMNYYYAVKHNEPENVALAMREYYLPRFSGDILPSTNIGQALAIADRIDHLVGAFFVDMIPTADKDPFGLRRAAHGIIRNIIENELELDLRELLETAKNNYQGTSKKNLIDQVMDFIFERLRAWYLEQSVSANVLNAVFSRATSSLLDCKRRIDAVEHFQQLPEAATLIAAHKRVNNILKKAGVLPKTSFDSVLFSEEAEKALAEELISAEKIIQPLYQEGFYTEALKILAELKSTVDNFFDKVMVMAEDETIRNNRLALLIKLRELFSYVADISLL